MHDLLFIALAAIALGGPAATWNLGRIQGERRRRNHQRRIELEHWNAIRASWISHKTDRLLQRQASPAKWEAFRAAWKRAQRKRTQRYECASILEFPDAKRAWVDPDDAPELSADWFERADLYRGDKLIRKGAQ